MNRVTCSNGTHRFLSCSAALNRRLDIEALRALYRVHELGGVTRAAQSLGLTQSAVSHRLARLERACGRRLLDRGDPGTGRLTLDGERLLGYARRILSLHDGALAELGDGTVRGRVSLGLGERHVVAGLAAALARCAARHPAMRVDARVASSIALACAVDRSELDLAVIEVFEHDVRPTDRRLGTDELVWIAAVDDFDAGGRPFRYVAYAGDCFYRRWAVSALIGDGTELVVTLECPSTAGVVAAVAAGLGVGLVARTSVTDAVRIVGSPLPRPPTTASVLRAATFEPSPAVAALVEELASAGCEHDGGPRASS